MNYLNVKWSAVSYDDPKRRITGDLETLVPEWMLQQKAGAEISEFICSRYFDLSTWISEFGYEEPSIKLLVTISEPEIALGQYLILMEQFITASSVKFPSRIKSK
jgi:hypothetical protein